ncbi:MAG TPA: hypothetical protein GX011_04835 [Clostridiales bacterium]|jgi:quercetin dioxygenase-like cupin family protein|nr:hypothetical protein [Clostridiales bacterium]
MIEKVYRLARGDAKTIEKVLFDENIHYVHMILGKDEGPPEHYSNSNVYMTVARGTLSIGLDDAGVREYPAGTLLKIPRDVKMNIKNRHNETLELIVVKAPAPGKN